MDKIPRRRVRPALGRKGALIFAALAILLGAAAVWWGRRPPAFPAPASVSENRILLDRPENEIAAIAITPPDGDSYPLVRTESGLRLLGREEDPLWQSTAENILANAAHMETAAYAADLSEAAGLSMADFGLQPPKARVVVTYADGEKAELLIGDLSPEEEPQYYAALGGETKVYTVLNAYIEDFLHDAWFLLEFEQPEIKSAFLDRIQISGDLTMDLFYAASGWQMEAPYRYPVDPAKSEAILQRIEAMAFESCLGTPEENDLDALGLQTPALTILLTQAATIISGQDAEGNAASYPVPARQYTLRIGNETGKSGVYLQWEDRIYKASNFLLGFWKELTAEEFLLRNPVNLLTNQLEKLTVRTAGHEAAYRLDLAESLQENGQFVTDEYGNILYDALVFRDGAQVDAQDFMTWYIRLSNIVPSGRLPAGYAPSGESLGTMILENEEIRREISFYPYDALHLAMAVDGVSLFYVDRALCMDALADCP